jgi:hypothetical protein
MYFTILSMHKLALDSSIFSGDYCDLFALIASFE